MMKFGTTLKTIQIALALTALTPVPSFAESPMTARQMLAQAQAQSQDRAVQEQARKIDGRKVVVNDVVAAQPTKSTIEPPVVNVAQKIPDAGVASNPSMAAANTERTGAALTPAAQPSAPSATSEKSETTWQTASIDSKIFLPPPATQEASVPQMIPALSKITAAVATAPSIAETVAAKVTGTPPAAAGTLEVSVASAVATAPANPPLGTRPELTATTPVSNASASQATSKAQVTSKAQLTAASSGKKSAHVESGSSSRTNPGSDRPHRAHYTVSYELSSSSVDVQIARVMRRPEIRSMLSQYGIE